MHCLRPGWYGSQLDVFRADWKAYFEPRIYRRTPVEDLSVVPRFHYRDETIGNVPSRLVVPFIVLTSLTLLIAAIAWRG